LKPNDEGSSLGTQIVRQPNEVSHKEREVLLNKFPIMIAEELIEGPEITVGVFDNKALPVIEIVPPENGEFDYDNKYNGKTQKILPPINVSADLQKRAQDLAVLIQPLAGCSGATRTDFMIKYDQLYVLENNTIPGLTE